MGADPSRIRAAWQGRISGCLLGKPLEVLSFEQGPAGVAAYLDSAGAVPLRDYVPLLEDTVPARTGRGCCRRQISRAERDDDIDYTVLALLMLEEHGDRLSTEDVARAWLTRLPGGATWTAEREAYRVLLENMSEQFVNGEDPGFDLQRCANHRYSDWIGAQIRADLYGWVNPGRPARAAEFARRDAALSHRGTGVHAAAFVAALAAALPDSPDLDAALDRAVAEVPRDSRVAAAVDLARSLAGSTDGPARLRQHYEGVSPLHAANNLALVVWALCSFRDDFSAAIGEAVAAGWDTDCNGATVGGLAGLAGAAIPEHWTRPWNGRIASGLAGIGELRLDDLVARTVAVAGRLA